MTKQIQSVVLVLFQGKALPASPAQQLEEVQADVEDLLVLKHHWIKRFDREVTSRVGVFERGHGGVKSVGLMAEGGVVHGDDLQRVLGGENKQHSRQTSTTDTRSWSEASVWSIPLRCPQQTDRGIQRFLWKSSGTCFGTCQPSLCQPCSDQSSRPLHRLYAQTLLALDLALSGWCLDKKRRTITNVVSRYKKMFMQSTCQTQG